MVFTRSETKTSAWLKFLVAGLLAVGIAACDDDDDGDDIPVRDAGADAAADAAVDAAADAAADAEADAEADAVDQDADADQASIQIIHNSPDPAVATVDVYVNDELAVDDLAFREATPYVNLPSGTALSIDLTAADAADSSNPLFTETVGPLDAGSTWVAIASGVVTTDDFEANPDGEDIAFMLALNNARQQAAAAGTVDLQAYHGVTDAPAIDVIEPNLNVTAIDDLAYGNFTPDFITVPASALQLEVTNADQTTTLVTLDADLSTLGGEALNIVASGFLTPDGDDQTDGTDGPAFQIIAFLPDGTSIVLPEADAQ